MIAPAAPVAQAVQAEVGRDPVEPRRGLALAAELLHRADHPNEDLLHGILRLEIVAQQAARTAPDQRTVRAVERFELAPIDGAAICHGAQLITDGRRRVACVGPSVAEGSHASEAGQQRAHVLGVLAVGRQLEVAGVGRARLGRVTELLLGAAQEHERVGVFRIDADGPPGPGRRIRRCDRARAPPARPPSPAAPRAAPGRRPCTSSRCPGSAPSAGRRCRPPPAERAARWARRQAIQAPPPKVRAAGAAGAAAGAAGAGPTATAADRGRWGRRRRRGRALRCLHRHRRCRALSGRGGFGGRRVRAGPPERGLRGRARAADRP